MLNDNYFRKITELRPLVRTSISKLIRSMVAFKTITTVQQANMLISVLLCKGNIQDYEETEQIVPYKGKAEI